MQQEPTDDSGASEKGAHGKRKKASGTVILVATVVGAIGTVAAVITAILTRSEPFTIQDWSQKATAACDTGWNNTLQKERAAEKYYQGTLQDYQNGVSTAEEFYNAGSQFSVESGAISQLDGLLGAIQQPNSRKDDVRAVFDLMRRARNDLDRAANELQQIKANPTSAPQLIAGADQDRNDASSNLGSAGQMLQDLGATGCTSS